MYDRFHSRFVLTPEVIYNNFTCALLVCPKLFNSFDSYQISCLQFLNSVLF
nr:MAG TPA: hypothetical protein [Caudoviricetes sp.]